MRILIYGVDGYIGWPLFLHLRSKGHEVHGLDNLSRRKWVSKVGGDTVTPILESNKRADLMLDSNGKRVIDWGSTNYHNECVLDDIRKFQPDTIVQLAEMPSAPYSMIGCNEAAETHTNNVIGTLNILWAIREVCPTAHLVKIGTLGEYGCPNIDITEGFLEVEYRGRKDTLPFPKRANSWYHLTKVHDTNNIEFACRVWGLRSTDIMQGIVYGVDIPETEGNEELLTRFDVDEYFGTIINRFCVQALIDMPLTLYGSGKQQRGFLPLKDSIQCLTIAIENPPKEGEYRVFNQFENVYTLEKLAIMVSNIAKEMGYRGDITHIENPRIEADEHYYNPDHQKLFDLGYIPTKDMVSEVKHIMSVLGKYKDRVKIDAILPKTKWRK